MLKALRDNLKHLQWILWAVIAAFVLLVFVDFGGAGPQGASATDPVVVVAGREVSAGEFERAYRRIDLQYRSIYGNDFTPELAQQLDLTRQTLDTLIRQRLLADEAQKMGLQATDAEVRDLILETPGFTDVSGAFIGQEQYEMLVRRSFRMTVPQFESEVRDEVLINKLSNVLSQTLYVAPQEVEQEYRDEVERAKIKYIRIAGERFANEVTIEQRDLEDYFAQHRAEYAIPERRVVSYLLVQPTLVQNSIEIGDEELRQYYDTHQDEFTDPELVRARHILLTATDDSAIPATRARLEELRQRIERGEDFAALAREFSEDETTRERGGELGYFERGRYNPALEEAAFAASTGELIGPIESTLINGTGLHLIDVQDHQQGGLQDFDLVRGGIRSTLLSIRGNARAQEIAEQLAQRAAEGETTAEGLQALAEAEAGATFETTEPFGRDDNVLGIGRATPFTSAAFSLEVGSVSAAVQVASGWAILHLDKIEDSRVPELVEVEEEVRDAVRIEKQIEASRERLALVAEELRRGQTIEEAATALQAEVQETEEFSRRGSIPGLGSQVELRDEVFTLAEGAVGGPIELDDGALVYQVIARTGWDPLAFEEEKSETRERVAQERLNTLLVSIMERRRSEEEIRPNTALLQALGVLDS